MCHTRLAIVLIAKAMFAYLDRAMVFDWKNLQASFDEISAYVGCACKGFLKTFLTLSVIRQPTGVMIKLKIISKHRHQTIDIVLVERIKYRAVHAGDRVE